jgi:hypothetical protein
MVYDKRTLTVICLGLAGLLSLGLSFMGFMILGIGEACCPGNTRGGWAYLLFAALLTLSVVVIILYAVWTPPKPLLVWSWAIAIVTALEVMTFQTYDPAKSTTHSLFFVFLSEWMIPQVWLPFGVAALCQIEARKGSRTDKSSFEA